MRQILYDYRKARFQDPLSSGYWVKLYILFVNKTCYTFFNNSDALENGALIHESDPSAVTIFHKEILVTPHKHPDIYRDIEEFENVLKSNSN